MFIKKRNVLNIFLILTSLGVLSACADESNFVTGGTNCDNNTIISDDIFKPFHKDLYFGRSKLNVDEKKVYDLTIKTMLGDYSEFMVADDTGGRVKIDLVKNNIKNIKNSEMLLKILSFIDYDEPRFFHIASRVPMPDAIGYATAFNKDSNGNIKEFYIRMHKEYANYNDYQDDMRVMEVRAKAVIDAVGDISKMSEAQIVRKTYEEYLATVSYGMKGSPSDIRGSFLKPADPSNGYYKVLCDGYARSMLYMLQRLRFKSVYIIGTANGGMHAWNKVQINGNWYNFDSTWDDYKDANSPESNKDNFLKSDTEFKTLHTGSQKEPNGKITGYLKYGISIPATPVSSLDPSEYQ